MRHSQEHNRWKERKLTSLTKEAWANDELFLQTPNPLVHDRDRLRQRGEGGSNASSLYLIKQPLCGRNLGQSCISAYSVPRPHALKGLCEKQVPCLLSIQLRRSKCVFQISTVVLQRNSYLIIHLLTQFLKDLAKLQWFFFFFRWSALFLIPIFWLPLNVKQSPSRCLFFILLFSFSANHHTCLKSSYFPPSASLKRREGKDVLAGKQRACFTDSL